MKVQSMRIECREESVLLFVEDVNSLLYQSSESNEFGWKRCLFSVLCTTATY